MNEATADRLSDKDVQRLNESGRDASVPGTWFRISAVLPRASVRKIARWELYTHIHVEGCRTGQLVAIVSSAKVEGTDGDFHRVRELLRSDPRRTAFVLSGPAFFQQGKPLEQLCLRLEGGSYTLQKIITNRLPLKFRRH
jgi:hypothetical protein